MPSSPSQVLLCFRHRVSAAPTPSPSVSDSHRHLRYFSASITECRLLRRRLSQALMPSSPFPTVIAISGMVGSGSRRSRSALSPTPSPTSLPTLSPFLVLPSPPSGGRISFVGSTTPPLDTPKYGSFDLHISARICRRIGDYSYKKRRQEGARIRVKITPRLQEASGGMRYQVQD